MQVALQQWSFEKGWERQKDLDNANLVIYFGGREVLTSGERYRELKSFYPNAHIIGCSTGGEIFGQEVLDNTVVASAIYFEKTNLLTASINLIDIKDPFLAGEKLANILKKDDLINIFVLSDGTNVNGSELVRGIFSVVEKNVILTGGLAGDGADFLKTLVGVNEEPKPNCIAAIGFYGKALKVGYGSAGGWNVFGPIRHITRSKGNILYELDKKPALDLYKQYLGDNAIKLPSSGLLFPLTIQPPGSKDGNPKVRTVIAVNEIEKSMTFAGDMPEGYTAQLMHSSLDNLIAGAAEAANLVDIKYNEDNSLVILVSCIGRKLLLGQNIADETEAVAEIFKKTPSIGFYSYGEICHNQFTKECNLHNQTMTITVFNEEK